ncbi:MAG: ThuA domain-containing protein [Planctomycetes bacterium]|nr:ThuA domain-containing protein [Planctomycetota bacterium]
MGSILRLAVVMMVAVAAVGRAEEKNVRVVVWDERQPKQQQMYKNFLGNHIAEHLRKQKGFTVRSVGLDDPQQGLSDDVLDKCDVLIWWGHVRQGEVSIATGRRIVERIKAGKLSLLTLHSAHWSTPFMVAMEERTKQDALAKLPAEQRAKAKIEWVGKVERKAPKRDAKLTPSVSYEKQADGGVLVRIVRPNCCFPAYAAHGKPSKVKTVTARHPIARGVPKEFTLPQTEMYDEPFHVPKPDAVVFEERWEDGQWFRAGMVWKIGKGQVFYFRPGHENFNVFHQPVSLKIVANAARWLGGGIAKGKTRR